MASTTWVPDVSPDSPFSLANLPFGIVSTPDDPSPHPAVAIGSHVLDLKVLSTHARFAELFPALGGGPGAAASPSVFSSEPTLNAFAALGRGVHRAVRETVRALLSSDPPATAAHAGVLRDDAAFRARALVPRERARVHLPVAVGDYTDFYAGYHHAHAVGSMFRGPRDALQPNYAHLPVGYHGRASSIVVSGTPVRRPRGQILLDAAAGAVPSAEPCRRLDMELELGCLIATPNEQGSPVAVADAEEHIFGYVLFNDWSARDIQTWEYVPLGPFNSKNFCSTMSPWVVLADALEPFRTRGIENKTPLLDYLREDREDNVLDVELEVDLESKSAGPSVASSVAVILRGIRISDLVFSF